ncbi:hypothetical protein TNCV_4910481 [Trichonephila clavipes]|nr:hypothetical protein TNCV_4910481 [Trichonephila clavipes]
MSNLCFTYPPRRNPKLSIQQYGKWHVVVSGSSNPSVKEMLIKARSHVFNQCGGAPYKWRTKLSMAFYNCGINQS